MRSYEEMSKSNTNLTSTLACIHLNASISQMISKNVTLLNSNEENKNESISHNTISTLDGWKKT